jgi:hypothetical protein
MFESHQVLAVGGISRDLGGEVVLVVRAPSAVGEISTGVADTFLVNLEPVAITSVAFDAAARRLGHVD